MHSFRGKLAGFFLTGLFAAAIGFVVLVVSERAFLVSTDFLLTQTSSNSQDLYTLSRSAEYAGNVLGEVFYSERFIDAVVATGKVNSEFLPFDKKARLDEWARTVHIDKQLNIGILKVQVFGDNQQDTERTAAAIVSVLTEKTDTVLGENAKDMNVSVLSGPIIERNPSGKQIALVIVAGFVFGVLLYGVVTFLRGELRRVS